MDTLICHRFAKERPDGSELASFLSSIKASFGEDVETATANLSFMVNKKNNLRYVPLHTAIFSR
jgi:hypothetical protein